MTLIKLDTEDIQVCRDFATERQYLKDQYRIPDGKIDENRTGVRLHFEGLLGEMAVAKYFGVPLHHIAGVDGLHGDNRIADYTIGSATIEVKTRPRPGLDFGLGSPDPQRFRWDYAILTWIRKVTKTEAEIQIVGYLDNAGFWLYWEHISFGVKRRDAGVRHHHFRPIHDLYTLLQSEKSAV